MACGKCSLGWPYVTVTRPLDSGFVQCSWLSLRKCLVKAERCRVPRAGKGEKRGEQRGRTGQAGAQHAAPLQRNGVVRSWVFRELVAWLGSPVGIFLNRNSGVPRCVRAWAI